MGIVTAMGYELSQDLLRAARLSDDLRESQQRMALATHAVNLGIWVRDLVRNEVWATDKWRELLGFAKSERIDLNSFLQKLHPEDREAVSQTFAKALSGEGGYETEYRVVLPDGRTRWIASRGRFEFSGAGKPVLMRGASLDITTRKQAEEELFRGRKLESLGVLAGGIAHDFTGPRDEPSRPAASPARPPRIARRWRRPARPASDARRDPAERSRVPHGRRWWRC